MYWYMQVYTKITKFMTCTQFFFTFDYRKRCNVHAFSNIRNCPNVGKTWVALDLPNWSILVHTGMYQYENDIPVCTGIYRYIQVYTGTYRHSYFLPGCPDSRCPKNYYCDYLNTVIRIFWDIIILIIVIINWHLLLYLFSLFPSII